MESALVWDIDFSGLINEVIEIETVDGTIAKDTLIKVNWQKIKIIQDGKTVEVLHPKSLILGTDYDLLVNEIASIKLP